nr:MAG TPA: hypothetical protein [Bacteriophage sp.]
MGRVCKRTKYRKQSLKQGEVNNLAFVQQSEALFLQIMQETLYAILS